jgi:hypothetical protein
VSSKKIIIMPNPEERAPAQAEAERPYTSTDVHNLSIILGRLEKGVSVLEATSESHTERIEQLTQWVSAIPHIEKDVAQNAMDLNELGRKHTKDLNELGGRLERDGRQQTKDLNELGIRLGKEIGDLRNKDIGDLKNVVHTAKVLSAITLVVIGPVAAAIITAIIVRTYQVVERLLSLANSVKP